MGTELTTFRKQLTTPLAHKGPAGMFIEGVKAVRVEIWKSSRTFRATVRSLRRAICFIIYLFISRLSSQNAIHYLTHFRKLKPINIIQWIVSEIVAVLPLFTVR